MLLSKTRNSNEQRGFDDEQLLVVEEVELPVINVSHLAESDEVRREECKSEIAKASQEWGFFQIVIMEFPRMFSVV